jgi:hypothetical protein
MRIKINEQIWGFYAWPTKRTEVAVGLVRWEWSVFRHKRHYIVNAGWLAIAWQVHDL